MGPLVPVMRIVWVTVVVVGNGSLNGFFVGGMWSGCPGLSKPIFFDSGLLFC